MSRIVGILDRGYSLIWREGRLEHALGGLDDDFEWVATDFLDGAVHRGPASTIEFFRSWMAEWEDLEVDWQLEQVDDERALAVIDMRGRGRESGVPARMRFGQVWTMRDGRLKRMVMYLDPDEARREAGLE